MNRIASHGHKITTLHKGQSALIQFKLQYYGLPMMV